MAKERVTIEDLARMVQEGFMEMKGEFGKVYQRLDSADRRAEETNKRLAVIEQNQEELKLRQDNVPYRFELNALNERMTKIEHGHSH